MHPWLSLLYILRVFDLLIDPTPGLKADERPGKKGHKLYPAPGQIAELASIESLAFQLGLDLGRPFLYFLCRVDRFSSVFNGRN